ncbi:lipoprotein, putative [Rhodobacteraceae bacterium KLH11]|nr:lipoprotein, putative [Rhodobacteraceae bacterium KLH11]
MVQNNKVLTVSYGTFSCTLEGFDNSFETMKAIAEYFRDLAAEDRYFGSEPPQPDAEMLTRIAQRDMAHKVEASQSDTGLLLRATETSAAAAPTPAALAPAPVAEPVQDVVPPAPSAPEATPVAEAAPEADSIAAKLQRIRAVVSHSEDAPAPYAEDEDNSYLQPAKPQYDAISAAFEAGALDPTDLEQPVQDPTPPTMPAPEQPSAEPDLMDTGSEQPAEADELPTPDAEEPVAREDTTVEADEEAAPDTDQEVDLTALVATQDEMETPAEAEAPEEVSAEVTDKDVLFSDLDDISDAEDEGPANILSDADSDESADTLSDMTQGVITAEEEALLLDEITLVESELAANMAAETPDLSGADEDVSRLMDSANARLDDPASADQRETYSHLRTAVAATEAEREKNGDALQSAEDDYRGDLASVVNPRRPEVQVTSERPSANIAAPLKLVEAQRVDTENADTGPISPRRVTSAGEAPADEDEGGFATFAQEQGAQSLPDLLEAAAAYLSFIEGQEQFSRPQLMNKVRSLKQDAFNREESLRSFGQLLRDGKIEKAGGGRFAASTQIGFRPDDDERAAG